MPEGCTLLPPTHPQWADGHIDPSLERPRDSEPVQTPKPDAASADVYDSLPNDTGPALTLAGVRPPPEASFICGPMDTPFAPTIRCHDPGPHRPQRRSHPQQQHQQPTRLHIPPSRQKNWSSTASSTHSDSHDCLSQCPV